MSSAPRMTVRQIASAAGCHHSTVRDVVARLFPEKTKNGIRLEFTEAEAFAIAAELPKRNFIAAPSGKPKGDLSENRKPRLSGALLRELRLSVKAGILQPADPRRLLSLDLPAALPPPSEADRFGFAAQLADETGVPPGVIVKAERAAAATAQAVIRRELEKASADRAQGRLL